MDTTSNWENCLKSAHKTCLTQDGKQKVHYTFTDGTEMVEEYDRRNYDLLVRKVKKKSSVSRPANWECEVGQDLLSSQVNNEGIVESSANPVCVRCDSRECFEWRIRNLPYSLETFSVTVNDERTEIVIRTTNKKYFKKLIIEDMNRLKLHLDPGNVQFAHANNTLVVKYIKPSEVLKLEQAIRSQLDKHKTTSSAGDVNMCNPS